MPLTLSELGLGFGLPAIIAVTASLILRWSGWWPSARRQATSLAFAGAFLAGCYLTQICEWQPQRDWEWIVYVVGFAALCGPIAAAPISWFERLMFFAVISLVAAWFLIPTWESIEPSRRFWLVVMTFCVIGLAGWIEFLALKSSSTMLASALFAVALCASVLIFLSGSARFAQVMLAASGAMGGLAISSIALLNPRVMWPSSSPAQDEDSSQRPALIERPMRGLGLTFSVLLVGMLLVARLYSYSKVPTAPYLMIVGAPAILSIFFFPPLTRLKGVPASLLQIVLVCAVLVAAIIVAVMHDPAVFDTLKKV